VYLAWYAGQKKLTRKYLVDNLATGRTSCQFKTRCDGFFCHHRANKRSGGAIFLPLLG